MTTIHRLIAAASLAMTLTACGLFTPRVIVQEREVQVCTPDISPYSTYGGEVQFQTLTPQKGPARPTPVESEDADDGSKD